MIVYGVKDNNLPVLKIGHSPTGMICSFDYLFRTSEDALQFISKKSGLKYIGEIEDFRCENIPTIDFIIKKYCNENDTKEIMKYLDNTYTK